MNNFYTFWNKKWKEVSKIWPTDFWIKTVDFILLNKWKLLDLWCGSWRDSLLFAQKGFQVDAFDFSENALRKLDNFVNEESLQINTILWEIKTFNFWVEKYDFLYSCNSLHYFSDKENKIIFEKLKKCLKKWGYIFIRLKSVKDSNFWKWDLIEENYFKNWEDIKHFFSLDYLKSFFTDFEIIKLAEIEKEHNKLDWSTITTSFIDFIGKK